MTKYKGYAGKFLRVNLTKKTFRDETLRDDLVENYLGGEGFGARILWDELKLGIDPLAPDNKIIFVLGPLQGTQCPSVSRVCAVTKSPLTGGFTRSFSGGDFAHELKRTGYDAIIVEGKSLNPVYIWIKDGKVEVRDASFIWGMCTGDTQKFIKNYTDQKGKVLCIGPAGENLVRFACIIAGIGAFGRGGLGAVMGSKNLKAIAVRATKDVEVFDPSGFNDVVKEVYANFARQKDLAKSWRLYGTVDMVDIIESHGNWPTRNFQKGIFPEARDALYSVPWRKNVVRKDIACTHCPLFCKKITFGGFTGPFAGISSQGPEYETVWAFGAQCGNANPKAITAADRFCDELGLDTISCGNVIGFAMELYQRKIITTKDTDGLELEWGNAVGMVEMVRRIGYRAGLGDVLAEGVVRASEKIGKSAEGYAMHVKGLELPAYDPRGQFGMGLNYATANRGGCHCSGYTTYDEVVGPLDGFTTEGKGELIYRIQNDTCVKNSSIICTFGDWGTKKVLDNLLITATGFDFANPVLTKIGERIFNLERAFNVREGFTRGEDVLPKRLLTEPFKEGPAIGHVVDLEPMLKDYYELRGWDKKMGIPTRKKLEELGLRDVADELERLGKLP